VLANTRPGLNPQFPLRKSVGVHGSNEECPRNTLNSAKRVSRFCAFRVFRGRKTPKSAAAAARSALRGCSMVGRRSISPANRPEAPQCLDHAPHAYGNNLMPKLAKSRRIQSGQATEKEPEARRTVAGGEAKREPPEPVSKRMAPRSGRGKIPEDDSTVPAGAGSMGNGFRWLTPTGYIPSSLRLQRRGQFSRAFGICVFPDEVAGAARLIHR
jgi:hypothetical protein